MEPERSNRPHTALATSMDKRKVNGFLEAQELMDSNPLGRHTPLPQLPTASRERAYELTYRNWVRLEGRYLNRSNMENEATNSTAARYSNEDMRYVS